MLVFSVKEWNVLKKTSAQIISELRTKLPFDTGRHLYAVIGSYEELKDFKETELANARDTNDYPLPAVCNLSYELLTRIKDPELRDLVGNEARRPLTVISKLEKELNSFLNEYFSSKSFLILEHMELIFTYQLDFSVFRRTASNQNHILFLLPAERRGDQIVVFHQADIRFHRSIPENLIADNHVWELTESNA